MVKKIIAVLLFSVCMTSVMVSEVFAIKGINIFTNSDYRNGIDGFYASSANISVDTDEMFQNMPSLKVIKTANGGKATVKLNLLKGMKYLFISNIKSESENTKFEYAVYHADTNKTEYIYSANIGTSWRTFKTYYTAEKDEEIELYIRVNGNASKGDVYYINNLRCICMSGDVGENSVIRSAVYVDGTSGNDAATGQETSPYKTLERAINSVRDMNKSVDIPITVYVKGGSYDIKKTIKLDNSCNRSAGMRIIAYDGEDVQFTCPDGAFEIGADNVEISKIKFKDFEMPCVTISQCDNVTIRNCEFEKATAEAIVMRETVTNTTVENCTFSDITSGVVMGDDFGNVSSGNIIKSNVFEKCTGVAAIIVRNQKSAIVEKNLFRNCTQALVIGGTETESIVSEISVRKNDIRKCSIGLKLSSVSSSDSSYIAYNYISGCSGNSIICDDSAKGFIIQNNVLCSDAIYGVNTAENNIVCVDELSEDAVGLLETAGIANIPYPVMKFTDIKGHWAESVINEMTLQGFIKGRGQGIFSPEDNTTRGEFILMVSRLCGENVFEDLFEDETMKIRRKEMALIVARAVEFINAEYEVDESIRFSDIYDALPEEISIASSVGIMSGDENRAFRPEDNATRAEAATVLARLYKINRKELF